MLRLPIFFIFIFYAYEIMALPCVGTNISLLNTDFFEKLSVPNCTQELIMGEKSLCECADQYQKFDQGKKLSHFSTTNFIKKSEEKLLRMSKGKIASILYDLEYANTMFQISPEEKKSMIVSCNLESLKELTNQMCDSKNMMGNSSIEHIISEMKNEFKLFHGSKLPPNENSFFTREHNSSSCKINDALVYKINNYHALTSLLIKTQSGQANQAEFKERLSATPLGRVLMLSSNSQNLDFNEMNDFEDIQNRLNDEQVKKSYIENFKNNCQQDLKDVATVLCSNLADSSIPFEEFEDTAGIKEQFYEDVDEFDSKKFLDDQTVIVKYCVRKTNESVDKFSPLMNLLKYGERPNSNTVSPEILTRHLSNNDLFNPSLIAEDEDFQSKQYIIKFEDTREKLCQHRPLTIKKLTEEPYLCHFDSFQENYDKNVSASGSSSQELCPYLVLDYILNTPTEELKAQNIDKDLIAYKRNIEKNKKSNGGDLVLDFLGVQSPQDIKVFKEAGVERKSSKQSNDNSSEKSSNPPSVTAQKTNVPNNNAVSSYAPANNVTGQNVQTTYNNGSTQNYHNSAAYKAMSPQEKAHVSEVERELMRRLMGSKVSESSNAARAEMYEKYSKEMMELAKEKMRIEAASEKPSSKELAAYEKKMQDMVNKMRAENKKLATALNNSSEGTSPNNFSNDNLNSSNGTPNKGSNFMATTASSHEREVINPNSKFNRALNETVNAEKFYELTGKKPDQNTQTDRSLASNSSSVALTLIENDKIIDISSLKEVLSVKLQEKKPFVIAQKDNPDFKVRIIPGNENEVTIAPLGDLNNPSYKMFYEEIEQSYQEIQEYHLGELTNKLLEIR